MGDAYIILGSVGHRIQFVNTWKRLRCICYSYVTSSIGNNIREPGISNGIKSPFQLHIYDCGSKGHHK